MTKYEDKIHYYQDGNNDIFSIRGTKDMYDLLDDIGIANEMLTTVSNPVNDVKVRNYYSFIKSLQRPHAKTIVVGHSLGSIELNKLLKFKDLVIDKSYGYAYTSTLPVDEKYTKVFSYDKDPLHMPQNKPNYFTLKKDVGININPFYYYHGIQNYT